MKALNYDVSSGYQTGYLKSNESKINSFLDIPLDRLYNRLCSFHLEISGGSITTLPCDPVLSVYENLIMRGIPTFCSLFVEENLIKIPYLPIKINKETKAGTIGFISEKTDRKTAIEWYKSLGESLILIDPRVKTSQFEGFDSNEERSFLQKVVPRHLGEYTIQLIEPQREINTVSYSPIFCDQRIDFTIDIPESKKPFYGAVIEIDGIQHAKNKQRALDSHRDVFLKNEGFDVIRLKTDELKKEDCERLKDLKVQLNRRPYFKLAKQNFKDPLWNHEIGKAALQFTLTPFIIARYQYTLLQLLKKNLLELTSERWNIAVLEQDVPFAYLATLDFLESLENLLKLRGQDFKLPEINLKVYCTPEFKEFYDFSDNQNERVKYGRLSIDALKGEKDVFDVVIDASILQRKSLTHFPKKELYPIVSENGTIVRIRSSHHVISARKVSSNDPIDYRVTDKDRSTLKFFLQNLFRKEDFREGQVEIISKALRREDVIALLPTGAGKSICYQLSALLQPGITLVIDPLRSLMLDQAENLKDVGIDLLEFINSEMTPKERERAEENLSKGKYLFVFIAPERLQIKKFRHILTELTAGNLISYIVIDEAHCVSEWGHDFRTSYLNIGRISKEYCKYKGVPPPILALTGTASYAVLTDVKREIGVIESDAVVSPTSFDRPELKFEVIKVPSKQKKVQLNTIIEGLSSKFDIQKEALFQDLGQDSYSGLVFCPHVNGKYGVLEVASALKNRFDIDVEFYSGKKPRGLELDNRGWDVKKRETQRDFKDNKFPLLVSTKAFGMGIDKPNIRYTIHYGIPHSIEAFYQEAGRAGRNRKDSYCTIIFSDDSREDADKRLNVDSIDDLQQMRELPQGSRGDVHRILFFHKNSFKGVKNEIENIEKLLDEYIFPALNDIPEDEDFVNVIIPFDAFAEQDDKNKESKKVNGDRNDIEKAIYRLTILGLIDDYTLDYHTENFEAAISRKDESKLIENLITYVGRYKTSEYTKLIPSELDKLEGTTTQKCVQYLINFVYNEIEKKRRRAISEMADTVRNFTGDSFFRTRVVNYFDSKYKEELEQIAMEFNPKDWWELLEEISDYDDIQHLLGGCGRTLESYPEHPGLLLLSCFARISTHGYSQMALNDFKRAVKVIEKFRPKLVDQEEIFFRYIKIVCKEHLDHVPQLLQILFEHGDYRAIAKFTLETPNLQKAHLQANIVFMKSIHKNLKMVNETFTKLEG